MKLKILKLVNLLFYNCCFFISKIGFYNCFIGIQIRGHNLKKNYIFLFLNQNICCGYTKFTTQNIYLNKKIITFLCLYFLDICFSSF